MKATLIGYGKMGKEVEAELLRQGHTVVSIIDPKDGLFPVKKEYIQECDICIDFSQGRFVLANARAVARFNKPLLIGATGWEEELSDLKDIVDENQMGCLYAPNFSLGVALFKQVAITAATLFDPFPEYARCGVEMHHQDKLDSPSGTSKMLAEAACLDKSFTSVRCGHFPGTHTLYFDGESDTITLSHVARSREGFAKGAVFAAGWLIGKQGFYTLDDALCHYLKDSSQLLSPPLIKAGI